MTTQHGRCKHEREEAGKCVGCGQSWKKLQALERGRAARAQKVADKKAAAAGVDVTGGGTDPGALSDRPGAPRVQVTPHDLPAPVNPQPTPTQPILPVLGSDTQTDPTPAQTDPKTDAPAPKHSDAGVLPQPKKGRSLLDTVKLALGFDA